MQAGMRCIELVEMNRFLSACRVLEIEQRFYQNEKKRIKNVGKF